MDRRTFIKTAAAAGALAALPLQGKQDDKELFKVSVLYTVDTGLNASDAVWPELMSRRAAHIEEIRRENPFVLLADAGSSWSDGLYNQLFRGSLEMDALERSGYDVAMPGPRELRNGQGPLQQILQKSRINWVLTNYDLSASPLGQVVRPFMIREVGNIRIGILALAPNPENKVFAEHREGIFYRQPLDGLQALVNTLRTNLGCRLLLVLSQLQQEGNADEPGNLELAREIAGIDLIAGRSGSGESIETLRIASKNGYFTRVAALGKNGDLGRTDFYFDRG